MAWVIKSDQQWKSKTFHLIEEVDLCSRDQLDRARITSGQTDQQLCSFLWNDTMCASLQNGIVKTLNFPGVEWARTDSDGNGIVDLVHEIPHESGLLASEATLPQSRVTAAIDQLMSGLGRAERRRVSARV